MTRTFKIGLGALGLAGLLAGVSFADARGVQRHRRIRGEIALYAQKVRELEVENAALRREISALSGDLGALEAAAREDLGLVRANEVVFTFE